MIFGGQAWAGGRVSGTSGESGIGLGGVRLPIGERHSAGRLGGGQELCPAGGGNREGGSRAAAGASKCVYFPGDHEQSRGTSSGGQRAAEGGLRQVHYSLHADQGRQRSAGNASSVAERYPALPREEDAREGLCENGDQSHPPIGGMGSMGARAYDPVQQRRGDEVRHGSLVRYSEEGAASARGAGRESVTRRALSLEDISRSSRSILNDDMAISSSPLNNAHSM
eukprot:5866614-Pyramimonas_sp.AAC.1